MFDRHSINVPTSPVFATVASRFARIRLVLYDVMFLDIFDAIACFHIYGDSQALTRIFRIFNIFVFSLPVQHQGECLFFDDVVVVQHSLKFIENCIENNMPIDYFLYPDHPHNIRGKDRLHLMEKVLKYIIQNNE